MRYTLNHKNYSNFNVFEENKLKGRAYFIPFKAKSVMDNTDIMTERYNSDMVTMLSGEWDFIYYNKVSSAPKQLDTDTMNFDKVTIPSCWQFTGYEKPYYVNQRYQFDPKPPTIPHDIPMAIYRKTINLSTVSPSEILTFLGVCANLELYINGNYVGYSEGSHNSAEFEVSKYLSIGENELVAIVYKFCNGSYLEAQDMFRNNGIFRDVYITHAGECAIFDYRVVTKNVGTNSYELLLDTEVLSSACNVKYTLMKGKTIIAKTTAGSSSEISLKVDDVKEWTCETPNLYTLYIELADKDGNTIEIVRHQIGFRNVEIVGDVLYFNGKNIKILGVNHHDSTEHAGYVMTMAEMERDILLMKEYNCNAVRTSHYPPDPAFLKMCDKYGLYVVLEADIEAHGVGVPEYYRPNCITHNLKWKEHCWDRVKRAYERDKNSPSIFMWSLGNEAGGHNCQDYCYDNLKKLTSEPIHYEGAIRTKRWAYDVISTMYSSADECYRIAQKKNSKYDGKPFFMCEYAHAMGVGPGDLDYYVDSFLQSDRMLGACIWEWCDHAVLHVNDGSKYKYTYGGDHDEKRHDGNFCVDGLFFPDRTPHTGAICMKNCYRPMRASHVGGKSYEFTNIKRFTDTSDISIKWSFLSYGREASNGDISLSVMPMLSKVIDIDHSEVNGDNFIIFTYINKKTGKEIAREQIALSEKLGEAEKFSRDVKVVNTQDRIGFTHENGTVLFSKKNGTMLSYTYNQTEYINQNPLREDNQRGFIPTIYRAPIDNYMNKQKWWAKQKLDKTKHIFQGFEIVENRGVLKMKFTMLVGKKKAFSYVIKYKMYVNGSIDIKLKFQCNQLFAIYDLPKLGMTVEMPEEFQSVRYYGMGNYENYSDFSKQSVMGIYDEQVANFRQNYIKPQDSGNRSEVRWAEVTNGEGKGLKFQALCKPFNFQADNITLDSLKKAKHQEDAVPMNTTVVNIDDFIRGIGSNSCGPDTRPKYRFVAKRGVEREYKFRIIPM